MSENAVKDSTTRLYQSNKMYFTKLKANNYMSTVANGIDIESLKAQARKANSGKKAPPALMVQLS